MFPVNSFGSLSVAAGTLDFRNTTSGGVALLPYIDQGNIYNQWNFNTTFWDTANSKNGNLTSTNLAGWRCPSAPGGNGGGTPLTAGGTSCSSGADTNLVYIPSGTQIFGAGQPGISALTVYREGIADYIWTDGVRETTLNAYYSTNGGNRGGIFSDFAPSPADAPSAVALASIVKKVVVDARISKVTDGLSNTTLLIEKAGRNNVWVLGQLQQPTSTIPTMGGAGGEVVINSVVGGGGWADCFNYEWTHGVLPAGYDNASNGGVCVVNCSNANGAGLYSFHSGGGHALFGDGTVRFISANVDYVAFGACITQSGSDPALAGN